MVFGRHPRAPSGTVRRWGGPRRQRPAPRAAGQLRATLADGAVERAIGVLEVDTDGLVYGIYIYIYPENGISDPENDTYIYI